jgi:hypothetical protein
LQRIRRDVPILGLLLAMILYKTYRALATACFAAGTPTPFRHSRTPSGANRLWHDDLKYPATWFNDSHLLPEDDPIRQSQKHDSREGYIREEERFRAERIMPDSADQMGSAVAHAYSSLASA